MKKIGRPPRKDKPQRISLNLSQRAYRQLERMSRFAPSRSALVENLLEEAARKEEVK
jgi:hypothetical protein